MEAVRDEKVNAGLIIHESRFTYHEYGLEKIIDLGDWWEKRDRTAHTTRRHNCKEITRYADH